MKKKKIDLLTFLGQDTSKLNFIGSKQDLDSLRSCKNVVIAGSLGFVSLDPGLDPGADFVRQEPRSCRTPVKKILAQINKKPTQDLFLWIDKAVFDRQKSFEKSVKWLSCHDYYLSWGLRQKNPVILIGGYADPTGVNIEVYRFSNNTLREVVEYELDAENAFGFEEDLIEKLTTLKSQYPNYRLAWAYPLPEFDFLEKHVDTIGDEPFKIKPLISIHRKEKGDRKSLLLNAGMAGVCVLAILIYLLAIGTSWRSYKGKVEEFKRISKPYASIYQDQEESLELLEARKWFMLKENVEAKRMMFLQHLVQALAQIPDVIIKKVTVVTNPNEVKTSSKKSFVAIFQVPEVGLNALEQAKPLLDQLSEQMGCAVYMDKYRSAPNKVLGEDVTYREFIVNGLSASDKS